MECYPLRILETTSNPSIEEAHTFDASIGTDDEPKAMKMPSQIALIELTVGELVRQGKGIHEVKLGRVSPRSCDVVDGNIIRITVPSNVC